MIVQKTCSASQNIAHYIYPILSLTISHEFDSETVLFELQVSSITYIYMPIVYSKQVVLLYMPRENTCTLLTKSPHFSRFKHLALS